MEEETKNESFEELQQEDHQEKTVPTLERHNIPKGVPMKKVVFLWSAKACFAIGLLALIVGISALLFAMMSNQIASTLFAIAGFFPAPVATWTMPRLPLFIQASRHSRCQRKSFTVHTPFLPMSLLYQILHRQARKHL